MILRGDYPEIIVATPNICRGESEIDQQLDFPKALAIYCYDEITPNDVESAKNLDVGIILVDTRAYTVDRTDKMDRFDVIEDALSPKWKQKPGTLYLSPGQIDIRLPNLSSNQRENRRQNDDPSI